MRAVIQRVSRAEVRVEGAVVGRIGDGLVVLVGIAHEDTPESGQYLAEKIVNLRVFPDVEGRMNRSILDLTQENGGINPPLREGEANPPKPASGGINPPLREGDEANAPLRNPAGGPARILCVSQFTLYGDCRKGRRPSYDRAASPDAARVLYERFVEQLRNLGVAVETGRFQAMMDVELINDGPVTLLLDSEKAF